MRYTKFYCWDGSNQEDLKNAITPKGGSGGGGSSQQYTANSNTIEETKKAITPSTQTGVNDGEDNSVGGSGNSAFYATSYGYTSGNPQHISSYPESGMKPQGDGTYGYPTDMQIEQAANNQAIAAKQAQTVMNKYNGAKNMYKESDKSIEANARALEKRASQTAASDWQAQNQREQAVLSYILGQSGTGLNGSYLNDIMQAFATVDDMADVKAIEALKNNLSQIYADEANQKQQNANAENELALDTEASLDSLVANYAAQMSSLNPAFASGIYGTDKVGEDNSGKAEDERPGFFPYRAQGDLDKDLENADDLSSLTRLAMSNQNEANYDFAPIVDRENHTVYAPYWMPNFKASENMREAVTPREVGMIRGADELSAVKGKTKQQKQTNQKMADLQPYISGYSNRK